MIKKLKKILPFIVLTFGVQQLCRAQSYSPVIDTLTDYFDIDAAHKDGYEFAHHIIDMPSNTAQKCNKKWTRIIVNNTPYKVLRKVIDEKNDTIIYQGRQDEMMLSDTQKMERKKYWMGTSLEILSIAILNNKKNGWEIIYKKR